MHDKGVHTTHLQIYQITFYLKCHCNGGEFHPQKPMNSYSNTYLQHNMRFLIIVRQEMAFVEKLVEVT